MALVTKLAPADQRGADLHGTNVSGGDNDYGMLLWEIRAHGQLLDDLEGVRVASGNRIDAFKRKHKSEPSPHLPVTHEQLVKIEHDVELALVRTWRKHYLAPWAYECRGLGEKSIARLVAIIGEPTLRGIGHWEGTGRKREWVVDYYVPRTLAQLRAYCGVGSSERTHKLKGATQAELMQAGNPRAKKQLHVIAEAMLKDSCAAHTRERKARVAEEAERTGKDPKQIQIPWAPPPPDCTCVRERRGRVAYDAARLKYEQAVHERECHRCGPAGRPAPTGSPLSNGHKHGRALRATKKSFLADLWNAASALHEDHAGHASNDLQCTHARVNGRPAQANQATTSIHGTPARATTPSS